VNEREREKRDAKKKWEKERDGTYCVWVGLGKFRSKGPTGKGQQH